MRKDESEQKLTRLYLSQEYLRGLNEALVIKSTQMTGELSWSGKTTETDDNDIANNIATIDHLHDGMSAGTLEIHQMVQRSYGLFD